MGEVKMVKCSEKSCGWKIPQGYLSPTGRCAGCEYRRFLQADNKLTAFKRHTKFIGDVVSMLDEL